MEFFTEAVKVLQMLVIALGAGLAIWGLVNLLEGYGNDNPAAKSQGIKQLMAGEVRSFPRHREGGRISFSVLPLKSEPSMLLLQLQ